MHVDHSMQNKNNFITKHKMVNCGCGKKQWNTMKNENVYSDFLMLMWKFVIRIINLPVD